MKNTPTLLRRGNLGLVLFILVLMVLSLVQPEWRPILGMGARLALAAYCLINGAWVLRARRSIWIGSALLAVGLALFGTSLAGFGFTGTARTPWIF